ncbi:pyruvate carboxylase [Chachezhania sediminis]|uniref:pyruvate carboxylase n=1 Tax=Chachezhania sediminis TaxID=2599291 RepID=UPI00131DD35C|nr:pyruvate carboxylase [Chachezhania sediminis]
MAHVEFLDETMRDGQQSLWGMRMQAGMALPVSPLIDRTGFRVIDLAGSSLMEVLIKHAQENPWEGLDLLVNSMPRTRLRGGMRSNASVTFGVTPDALMDLWMRQLNEHGIRSFWIYDVLYNIDKMHRLAKVAKEYGSEVAGSIMYVQSPVHTDAYFADKAGQMAASPDIDTILLYDTAGVLEKERLQTLIPAIKAKISGKPLEFHANNILGQSGKAYLDAVDLGVNILHTASRSMANGPSVPSTESVVKNLEILGHTHSLDKTLFKPVEEHFRAVGKAAGFLVDQFNEYDVLAVHHQIPGGMTGTLKAQLAQHNMSDRLDDVLEETAKVRRELGYPGMATPFSQLVGTLAVLNVVTGKRYSIIPDEVIQYAAGYYGQTVAPIEGDVLDRIMTSSRAKEVLNSPPPQPSIEDLQKQYGTTDPDELILRALVPEPALARMRAAGAVKTDFPLLSSPELDQVRKLLKIASIPAVQIRSAQMDLTLRRSA